MLVRGLSLHLVEDAALGHNEEGVALAADGIVQQARGGAHHIGQLDDGAATLGMYEHLCLGILLLEGHEFLHGEAFVHVAGSIPQEHLATRDGIQVGTEVAVGPKDERLVLRKTFHYLARVAGRDNHVGDSLDGGRSIDVTNHLVVGMRMYKFSESIGGTTFGQGAGSTQVGNEHFLLRAEYFVGLAHKVHATHNYDVGIGLGGALC